jgi:glutathione S-transferase
MIRIETTADCNATPRVAFLMEELELRFERVVRPNGYFAETFGVPGPLFVDGDFTLLEANAIMRHLTRAHGRERLMPADLALQAQVDRWIDFPIVRFAPAVMRGDKDAVGGYLRLLDKALEGREWICGPFSTADCALSSLLLFKARLPLDAFPSLSAYLGRLAARPAWQRAQSGG